MELKTAPACGITEECESLLQPRGKNRKKERKMSKPEKLTSAHRLLQLRLKRGVGAFEGAASQFLPAEDGPFPFHLDPPKKPFWLLLATMSCYGRISCVFLWSKVVIFFKINFHRSFLLAERLNGATSTSITLERARLCVFPVSMAA